MTNFFTDTAQYCSIPHAVALLRAIWLAKQNVSAPAESPEDPSRASAALAWLCAQATSPDQSVARGAVRALFADLIEPLNDSFAPEAHARYNELFAQIIACCRALPAAATLDQALKDFGLPDAAALVMRRQTQDAAAAQHVPCNFASPIRRVLLLSRVTIGADVAITSVCYAGLRQRFPHAEFVWLGSAKLRELWGGDPHIRVRELGYERGGDLLSRLQSWRDVRAAVAAETQQLAQDEWLIIDPDSRFTQLGLLPLLHDESNYHFFPSRAEQPAAAATAALPTDEAIDESMDATIARLAARWSQRTFGLSTLPRPTLALPQVYQNNARLLATQLRQLHAKQRIITISFGVGGNEQKRVRASFEAALIRALANEAIIILDKGGNATERTQIDTLLETLGRPVCALDETNLAQHSRHSASPLAEVVTWDGGIGQFAGLIAASDEYIGYDSAGQHIAAALGVPTTTIFVNANTPRFAQRWHPTGHHVEQVRVLRYEAAHLPADEAILADVATARQRLRAHD